MKKTISFHIPQRPFSPIDAHNRSAAALGSPRYAQATSYASYNGHHVSLRFNEYRGYWVAEYFWAGRVVISRGSFRECLRAVISEYNKGDLGASASIYVDSDDSDSLEIARKEPLLVEGDKAKIEPFWTWRHSVGAESARDTANPGHLTLIFDWALCQTSESREAYEKALQAKFGRVYQ